MLCMKIEDKLVKAAAKEEPSEDRRLFLSFELCK